ncbi:gliding motility-associated C-terminal domain-containing protein [Spirosoma oryzicola]|uniref:T9SS type B sorting domain-containing protein n=1 Tax=Spirosoma oryzicola TaxID=2898794 RepID=UPI001E444C88|nr:gliding motility-associated C-terminal domain-containing protein [Spirosoma oryzicola]UHG89750.1 gliding motility-associated C-terminal domain-containing protein [Spirosoma oryzicola]
MLVCQCKSALLYWIILLALLPLAVHTTSLAQCAPGAIICETFGAGPRGALPSGQTNFMYRAAACPNDGEYNIVDAVDGSCHGDAWHTVTEDHTPGDVKGNMFIVNASFQPSEFFSQKAEGLCPGVTYEFSMWVLNINKVLQPGICDEYILRNPIIAMRVEQADGTLIREVVQPAVTRSANPVWVQLSMPFVIQTNANDVVVKLINKGLGGCGNDLIIDDISFRPVHPSLSIQFPNTSASETTVCADTRLTLSVGAAAGYPNPVYAWQQSADNVNWTPVPGSGQATYTINPVRAGRTYYRLRNAQPINSAAIGRSQCSAESNVLIVNGRPDAPFNLGDDLALCDGRPVVLQVPNELPAGTSFVWSDQSKNRQLTVSTPGSYWLETNLDGCTYSDTVQAELENCHLEDVYIPDAFSPNSDAVNDKLVVIHSGDFTSYSFRVYDRWGSVIFSSRQAEVHWDGTFRNQPCPVGAYAWTIDYSVLNAKNEERHFVRSGQVMLVR